MGTYPVLKPTHLPREVRPGDLIVSFDSLEVGILRSSFQYRLSGNAMAEQSLFWRVLWLKGPRNSWPTIATPDQYRDSDLRSEIAAGYWLWFPSAH